MNDQAQLLDPPQTRKRSSARKASSASTPVAAGIAPKKAAASSKTAALPKQASRKATPPTPASEPVSTKSSKGTGTRKPTPTSQVHTSKLLRDLLANPQESFSMENIVQALGGTSAFGASLMLFSLPEVLPIPIPGISAIVVIPVGVISAQMVAGNGQLKLPKYILKRTIHRKALAGAIHAILPVLERAEKVVKPRWSWVLHPAAKRLIGAIVFLLALAIALPVPGTNIPLAISIFVIAMGLAERDGKVVLIGILMGLASLALLGGIVTGILAIINAL